MDLDTKKFIVIGNNVGLDLVNTQIVVSGEPKDLLSNFQDFAGWMTAVGLVELAQAKQIVERWSQEDTAETVLTEVKKFRAVLREMVEALKNGETLNPLIIAAINRELKFNRGYAEIQQTDQSFEKRFRSTFDTPRELLAPVAEAAADLLCYGNPSYLRKCADSACVLLFYDTSKNHTRRWCCNKKCGNRAKAAAFYQRKKLKSGTIG